MSKIRAAKDFLGKTGSRKMIAASVPVGFGAMDYRSNRAEGDGIAPSLVKAGATAAMWSFAPAAMTLYELGSQGPGMVMGGIQAHNQAVSKFRQTASGFANPSLGGNYYDTNRALTMRQSAIQAIEGSKLNARSALGNEAKLHAR